MRCLFTFALAGCLPLGTSSLATAQAPAPGRAPAAANATPAPGPVATPPAGAIPDVVPYIPNAPPPPYGIVQVPMTRAAQSPEAAAAMREFSEHDARSRELAQQLRTIEAEDDSEAAKTKRDELRKELETTVLAAFEARQKVQQLEVDQLKKRLTAVEESLEKRASKKDQIIEGRIDDLLEQNQDLHWDPAGPRQGVTVVEQDGKTRYIPTPYPLTAPPAGAVPAVVPAPAVQPNAALPGASPARVKWTTAGPNPAGQSAYAAADTAGPDASLLKQHPLLHAHLAETRKALIDTEFALQQAQREMSRRADLAKTEKNPDLNATRVAEDNLALAQRHVDRVRQEYESQLRLLELQADSARTQLSEAERDYERVNSLGERGAVSRQEIDKRQTAAAAAKSELQSVMTLLDLHRRASGATSSNPPASITPGKAPSR